MVEVHSSEGEYLNLGFVFGVVSLPLRGNGDPKEHEVVLVELLNLGGKKSMINTAEQFLRPRSPITRSPITDYRLPITDYLCYLLITTYLLPLTSFTTYLLLLPPPLALKVCQ
jgi:hypothetical protein